MWVEWAEKSIKHLGNLLQLVVILDLNTCDVHMSVI